MISPLHARFGRTGSQEVVLCASILAADAAFPEGFRLADVQYLFFLFANWMERDLRSAGEHIELTQIRRVVLRLVGAQWVKALRVKGRTTPRHSLTTVGFEGLLSHLVQGAPEFAFDELVFVLNFVASYKPMLHGRASRDLRAKANPIRILRRAMKQVQRVLADLDERIRTSEQVAAAAQKARRARSSDADVARAIEQAGGYQLQHVRSFGDFVLAMPEELRAFELGPAFGVRSDMLFVTFAEQARAQLLILERLEQRLLGMG